MKSDLLLMPLLVGIALIAGCSERASDEGDVPKEDQTEDDELVVLGDDTLPALLRMEIAGAMNSVGGTTHVHVPLGAKYIVRVYLNRGDKEVEVKREMGRASAEKLEIGLYGIRDYDQSDGKITIHPTGELVVLDLPGSSGSASIPAWIYRPEVLRRNQVTATQVETAILVMYHPSRMLPGSFEGAVNLARERHIESLVATIQLKEPKG